MLSQQLCKSPGSVLVAVFGPGAQYLRGPVQVAALFQQPGQSPGGAPVAGVGPGAQPVQIAAFSQQPDRPMRLQLGQRPGGAYVAGVGPGAQPV